MTAYTNLNKASPILDVEFTHVPEGNFTFIRLSDPESKDQIKQWLTSKEVGQTIVAETLVGGKPMLITKGSESAEGLMQKLEANGDKLKQVVHKKPFNYWALRGGISVAGQTLHFLSSVYGVEQLGKGHAMLNPQNPHYNPKLKEGMWVRRPWQKDIGVFAVLNQTANLANIIYGGQQETGDNRLRAVKEEVNNKLDEHLVAGDTPIDVFDDRLRLRTGPKEPLTAWQKFNQFAKENSVRVFELGFRFVGASALVIPWRKASLSKGWNALKEGHVVEAWNAAKNKDWYYLTAGKMYLTGKTLALFAKVPDPYEDKPHTWVDTLREKVLFKTGSVIEAAAGGLMATNAFTQKKMGFYDPGRPDMKPSRDYMSSVGGALFFSGYIVRLFASYGTKQVNMPEVYAHAEDTLAKTPPEELPQLMADTAATLKEHFKDKPEIEFGQVFTRMMTDMYRYHHVVLDNVTADPKDNQAKSAEVAPEKEVPSQLTQAPRTAMDRVVVPASDKHVEKINNASEIQLGLGA